MKLLIACACIIVAVQCTPTRPKKARTEKTVKQLWGLCSAYDSGYITISDASFYDILGADMLGSFCDDFFAASNLTAKEVLDNVDGIKTLSKTCKSYKKKYSEEPTEGPLVGFEAICNATKEAMATTLNDKKSRKALAQVMGLCDAQEAGKVRVKISNYTDVFVQLEGFCDAYLNETTVTVMDVKRRGDSVDGVKALWNICRWYTKKFDEFAPEGSLALLEPVCEEYIEIKQALEEEEEEEEEMQIQ